MKQSNAVKCGALFAGMGGFCDGFEEEGFRTSWALDFDDQACETYEVNHPATELVNEDIVLVNERDLPLDPVDVLHAGFPCQSFSSAGNRKGFEDPRGALFFEIITLLERFGKDKPGVLVLENSPFLMHGKNGEWFDSIRVAIQRAGYWFGPENAVVVDARVHGGLPQRRERLIMVATSKDRFDYNPFCGFEAVGEIRELVSMLDLGEVDDDYYYLSESNKYGNWILNEGKKLPRGSLLQLRQAELRPQPPGICPTLTANMGNGGHNVPFVVDGGRLRKLTEKECLRLQGFRDDLEWPDIAISARYRLIGNSVSPVVSGLIAQVVKELFVGEFDDNRVGVSA